ncbi:MAG: DUF177 domain-containing protein [Chloroflexi bacterium]|nr:DUF177 domain-containing protein [Chloroflexota bacterium]
MSKQDNLLRLNVGFIAHEDVGYLREFDFEFPKLHLSPGLDLDDVNGSARFSRTSTGLLLDVNFSAVTQSECGRCLDEVTQSLETNFTELYAFNEKSVTESGLILPENGKIDLAPILREYLLLEMPINPLCRPNCLGLCLECGENLNDSEHTHEKDNIDPRLSKLKNLLDDD